MPSSAVCMTVSNHPKFPQYQKQAAVLSMKFRRAGRKDAMEFLNNAFNPDAASAHLQSALPAGDTLAIAGGAEAAGVPMQVLTTLVDQNHSMMGQVATLGASVNTMMGRMGDMMEQNQSIIGQLGVMMQKVIDNQSKEWERERQHEKERDERDKERLTLFRDMLSRAGTLRPSVAVSTPAPVPLVQLGDKQKKVNPERYMAFVLHPQLSADTFRKWIVRDSTAFVRGKDVAEWMHTKMKITSWRPDGANGKEEKVVPSCSRIVKTYFKQVYNAVSTSIPGGPLCYYGYRLRTSDEVDSVAPSNM